jgi:hypothetical protein
VLYIAFIRHCSTALAGSVVSRAGNGELLLQVDEGGGAHCVDLPDASGRDRLSWEVLLGAFAGEARAAA